MADAGQELSRKQIALDVTWKMTYRRLKGRIPDEIFHEWVDRFVLTELTEDRAVISFKEKSFEEKSSERNSVDAFWKSYQEVFSESLEWAAGRPLKIEFCPLEKEKNSRGKKKTIWKKIQSLIFSMFLIGMFVSGLLLYENSKENRTFHETFYQLASRKVSQGIRIVQLSDLHNTEFGTENEQLIKRVSGLEPDLILLTGDILDRRDASFELAVNLCRKLTKIAPCYYIYGNNETEKAFQKENMMLESVDELLGCTKENRNPQKFYELDDPLRKNLEEAGVNVLFNQSATISFGETNVDLFGTVTSSPGAFWEYAAKPFGEFLNQNPEHLKIFLNHEPTLFEVYGEERFGDLALCGHTHGGVMRFPHFGAFYIPSKGEPVFFPEQKGHFVKGQYELNGMPLIVNAGLTNRGMIRINNQPELVVIDINRY